MIRPKSFLKLQTYSGMPRWAATSLASAASLIEQHPWCPIFTFAGSQDTPAVSKGWSSSIVSPGEPRRMKTPTTSCPCSASNAAATDESTPPDIATRIFRRPSGRPAGCWGSCGTGDHKA